MLLYYIQINCSG